MEPKLETNLQMADNGGTEGQVRFEGTSPIPPGNRRAPDMQLGSKCIGAFGCCTLQAFRMQMGPNPG